MKKTIYITLNGNNNFLVLLDKLSFNFYISKTYTFITSIEDFFPYNISIPADEDIWRVEKDNEMLDKDDLRTFLNEHIELIKNMKEVIKKLK